MGILNWLRNKKDVVIAVPLAVTLALSQMPANAQVSDANRNGKKIENISLSKNINTSYNKNQGVKPSAFLLMDNYAIQKRWSRYYYLEDKSGNLVLNDKREILLFSTLASIESHKASSFPLSKIKERKVN